MNRFRWLALLVLMFVAVGCRGAEAPTEGAGNESASEASMAPESPGAKDEQSSSEEGTGSSSGGSSSTGTGGSAGTDGGGSSGATFAKTGTYRYATEGFRKIGELPPSDLPEETTLKAAASAGEKQTFTRDLRDADGNGTVTETDLLYRSDGVYLGRIKATSNFQGGGADVRELEPASPVLVAPNKNQVGYAKNFKISGDGVTADVTLKILRTEKITIGGKSVDSIVTNLKVTFSGEVTGSQESTSWFSLGNSLLLKEEVAGDVQNGVIRVLTKYEATLESLTP